MYDKTKVDWKDEEHQAAENADQIYEVLHPALADGVQAGDLAVVAAIFKPSMEVWKFLAGGNKAEFARKLIALGVMLERDNEFLGG